MHAIGQTYFGPYVCPDFTLTDGFRAELQQPLPRPTRPAFLKAITLTGGTTPSMYMVLKAGTSSSAPFDTTWKW